jgi:hypothetical protein
MRATSQSPASIAAAACKRWETNEEPPMLVASE